MMFSLLLLSCALELSVGHATVEDVMSFEWSSLPTRRTGYGVLFCAYSRDRNVSLPRFLKEAGESARILKANNPAVATAIITNAKRVDVPAIFDRVVPVHEQLLFAGESTRGDGIFRQWFSRIYYLAHSPFEVTWYIDSHAVFATNNLSTAFEVFTNSEFDIAVPSSRPHLFRCHNFALLFRWNWRVKNLFVDWIMRQLQTGISADDQGPLCRALFTGAKYGLRFTSISPQWALAWLSLNLDMWSDRTTRVFRGNAHICHSREANLCSAANLSQSQIPHMFYYTRLAKGIARVAILHDWEDVSAIVADYPTFNWSQQADRCTDVLCKKSEELEDEAKSYYFHGHSN